MSCWGLIGTEETDTLVDFMVWGLVHEFHLSMVSTCGDLATKLASLGPVLNVICGDPTCLASLSELCSDTNLLTYLCLLITCTQQLNMLIAKGIQTFSY